MKHPSNVTQGRPSNSLQVFPIVPWARLFFLYMVCTSRWFITMKTMIGFMRRNLLARGAMRWFIFKILIRYFSCFRAFPSGISLETGATTHNKTENVAAFVTPPGAQISWRVVDECLDCYSDSLRVSWWGPLGPELRFIDVLIRVFNQMAVKIDHSQNGSRAPASQNHNRERKSANRKSQLRNPKPRDSMYCSCIAKCIVTIKFTLTSLSRC